ncbi:MAG: hypothetical protein HRT68_14490, partial [Flavobacteriaceae bacterium]|nr:hypothetical protein [Flavobacteriaceae bacterium]
MNRQILKKIYLGLVSLILAIALIIYDINPAYSLSTIDKCMATPGCREQLLGTSVTSAVAGGTYGTVIGTAIGDLVVDGTKESTVDAAQRDAIQNFCSTNSQDMACFVFFADDIPVLDHFASDCSPSLSLSMTVHAPFDSQVNWATGRGPQDSINCQGVYKDHTIQSSLGGWEYLKFVRSDTGASVTAAPGLYAEQSYPLSRKSISTAESQEYAENNGYFTAPFFQDWLTNPGTLFEPSSSPPQQWISEYDSGNPIVVGTDPGTGGQTGGQTGGDPGGNTEADPEPDTDSDPEPDT